MTTLKERAEEYAKATTSGPHVPYFRDAYLAGAKAMHDLALKEIRAAESWADVDGRVQALLPDDAREPERRG